MAIAGKESGNKPFAYRPITLEHEWSAAQKLADDDVEFDVYEVRRVRIGIFRPRTASLTHTLNILIDGVPRGSA